MHAVRKRILEILKERGGTTVAELAEQLEMAPVSVRHHLDILQGDNLIGVERCERKGHVGRPQQIYGLTPEASAHFPNNFSALAAGLVRQIKRVLPPEEIKCAFESLAHELTREVVDNELADLPIEERLERVIEFLNARGYLARWEAVSGEPRDGYLLHKHNCPYAGVSAEHGELCWMDQTLINDLVGRPCQRVRSMAEDEQCCSYLVRPGDIGVVNEHSVHMNGSRLQPSLA